MELLQLEQLNMMCHWCLLSYHKFFHTKPISLTTSVSHWFLAFLQTFFSRGCFLPRISWSKAHHDNQVLFQFSNNLAFPSQRKPCIPSTYCHWISQPIGNRVICKNKDLHLVHITNLIRIWSTFPQIFMGQDQFWTKDRVYILHPIKSPY